MNVIDVYNSWKGKMIEERRGRMEEDRNVIAMVMCCNILMYLQYIGVSNKLNEVYIFSEYNKEQ